MEQQLIAGLVNRGMSEAVAKGIVANMIAESRLQPGINEAAPVVPGSRGGYGLNQWTGPRRRQYEAYAAERGSALDDVDTQLDFTVWELQNTEKAAGDALASATDPETAARIYSEKFLRPGIPHLDRRLSEARRLGGMEVTGTNQLAAMPQAAPQAMPNQLAEVQWQPQITQIDPRAFMTRRNQLQPVSLDQFRV